MSPDKITVTKPQAVEWTMRTDIHRNRQTGVSGSTEPGRKRGTRMKKRFGFKALVTAILLASSAALLLGAGPLKIESTQADLDAVPQTLTIEGQRFGSQPPANPPPDVLLDGDSLVVEIYNFDTRIVALLPPGILPGDYELVVIDSADPTRATTVTITIKASGPQKLEISGAEPDVGTGTILISGANLGDAATLPADFDVRLFVPDPAMVSFGTNVALVVTGFDPATQEISALLPAGLFPGTFRLTVSKCQLPRYIPHPFTRVITPVGDQHHLVSVDFGRLCLGKVFPGTLLLSDCNRSLYPASASRVAALGFD